MSKMTQVPKEDFEILSKYHPGEIRYYIDTGTRLSHRRKPTRVVVKRKPVGKKKGKAKSKKKAGPIAVRRGGNRPTRFVQLGTKGADIREGSKMMEVYVEVKRVFENDPTKVMSRPELTHELAKRLPHLKRVSTIVPSVTSLIEKGVVRYTGSQ